MSKFRTKLGKWTAVSMGDKSYDKEEGGGGNKYSSIELLTPDSEFTRGQPNSFSSAWKPIWYTGWHTGVLVCAAAVVVVLLINVGLTIYVATNPEYKMERGTRALYSGSCAKSKAIGLWLHLVINVLSTLLLSQSNYTQQCLAAPTRSEIDAAHAKRQWVDIGVPSFRNLFRIKAERTFLWIAIGITSVPLHLLYNSAVYTTLTSNQFFITAVTNNHFESRAYSNTTGIPKQYLSTIYNQTIWNRDGDIEYPTDSPDFQLFIRMLEGYNASTENYEDLAPSQCLNLYNTDFLSSHRNLFLITNHTSNCTSNGTLLRINTNSGFRTMRNSWICPPSLWGPLTCDTNELALKVARGDPWLVTLEGGEEVEVQGCKSEITKEKCKVQFSLGIMIAVIACNLVKACCMIMTVFRYREPTLVTLGDAIDSFLNIPDPTTMGICFADRRFIEREWKCGSRAGPRQWKQNGVQRWWTGASRTRWITCNFFCSVAIITTSVLLSLAIKQDRRFWSTDIKSLWAKGFGKVYPTTTVGLSFNTITPAVLLSNLPQTLLSFLYLTYNSLFTCMLSGHEWSLFAHHHRTLRVTSPRPGQHSTYWLQIPYSYAVPLMILSALLHWVTSQSIFFVRVAVFDPFGEPYTGSMNNIGYSSIAIIFTLALAIVALMTVGSIGCKKFAAEITTVGSCSAAISSACHLESTDLQDIIGKKVRWGDVQVALTLGVRHLTFSSGQEVRKPIFGEVYAGTGREKE